MVRVLLLTVGCLLCWNASASRRDVYSQRLNSLAGWQTYDVMESEFNSLAGSLWSILTIRACAVGMVCILGQC
jgi:hypothetical protein